MLDIETKKNDEQLNTTCEETDSSCFSSSSSSYSPLLLSSSLDLSFLLERQQPQQQADLCYGREKQLSAVHEFGQTLINSSSLQNNKNHHDLFSNHRGFCIISGATGVGKTTLLNSLGERMSSSWMTSMVTLEENDSPKHHPYASWTCIGSNIISQMLRQNKHTFFELPLRQALLKEFTYRELQFLLELIPELQNMIGPIHNNKAANNEANNNILNTTTTSSISTISRVLTRLIRIISTYAPPLLILVDDIQWMDSESIQVLREILTDVNPKSNNPLLILVTTSNHDNKDQEQLLEKLPSLSPAEEHNKNIVHNKSIFTKMYLNLSNWDLEQVQEVLSSYSLIIDDEDEEKHRMAKSVHDKTQGNPSLVMSLIPKLEQGFGGEESWEEILTNLSMEEGTNIYDCSTLPEAAQYLLKLATCLPSELMDKRLLEQLWERDCEDGKLFFTECLALVVGSWLQPSNKPSSLFLYHWVSTSAKEAVLDQLFLNAEEVIHYRQTIGMTLVNSLPQNELEQCAFSIATLLNTTTETENENPCNYQKQMKRMSSLLKNRSSSKKHNSSLESEQQAVVKVNILAAQQSRRLSSWETAAHYSLQALQQPAALDDDSKQLSLIAQDVEKNLIHAPELQHQLHEARNRSMNQKKIQRRQGW
eukprot:CAMPEP_0178929548 /NCGR_PEP_ID=MMETSP0786-20121207/20668_1 /TAXON_ID=186022 /ORGANISM="Thalassionema frauenfeldii, Strain CCMP 1798" /LENGTH=648 /DNA_ID=CAMNT_0020605831 /DNA_START=179 /DNA_END=2122 /DNA_ORIENTATION=-